MAEVCQGTKTKHEMLEEAIEQYQEMYVLARGNFAKVIAVSDSVS
jgi:DNA topoisomerase III